MTCRHVADFIVDYLAGELPAATHAAFEHHLSLCVNCRHYLALYRAGPTAGRRVLGADDDEAQAAGVPSDLIEAILAARRL